jgi:23S rRNA (uracil1939-C5)-methyltransferase
MYKSCVRNIGYNAVCVLGGEINVADDTLELELVAMAHGGSALGRDTERNRTVFVPYTIPGERIVARVTRDRGRIAFAEGETLLEASADRVFPICPHFGPGRCGRCHWQHIDYAAQLLLKQDVLADQLARIAGLDEIETLPVIGSPEAWYYNFHMTLLLAENGAIGFPSADDPERVFPISECHIIHPDLLALFQSLNFEELTQAANGGIERIRLQIGSDGAHMLILYMSSEEAPNIETDMPTSVNMLLPDNEPVNLIGESHSRYWLGGREFRVTAGSAFRANVLQLENLVSLVLSTLDLTEGEAVLDLYAGVGLFSAFIAPTAGLVTLVESYPPAATDADENLADFENVDVIEGTVEDVLDGLLGGEFDSDIQYTAAILDPPAEGLDVAVVDLLGDLRIPRLVYVSDDPATLARDSKRLGQHGYRLVYVQPIDLAPQTYYIDTVARFEWVGD